MKAASTRLALQALAQRCAHVGATHLRVRRYRLLREERP